MPNDDDADRKAGSNQAGNAEGPGDVLPDGNGAEGQPTPAPNILTPHRNGHPPESEAEVPPFTPADGVSDSNEYGTPRVLFNELSRRYGPFTCDLAASSRNRKCDDWFSKEANSLTVDWGLLSHIRFWLNPPYSRGMQGAFVAKARAAVEQYRKHVCLLIQATTETEWWQDYVWGGADLISKGTIAHGPLAGVIFKFETNRALIDVIHLRGRVSFEDPATGLVSGNTGTTGNAVVAFMPRGRK
jgi:phage N-6-adenine-methyltransferase